MDLDFIDEMWQQAKAAAIAKMLHDLSLKRAEQRRRSRADSRVHPKFKRKPWER